MSCNHGAGFPKEIANLLGAQVASMRQPCATSVTATLSDRAEEERLLSLGLRDQEKVRGVHCTCSSHLSDFAHLTTAQVATDDSKYLLQLHAVHRIGD